MQRKKLISYGWLVLIACAAIQLYFSATFVTGFTAFFNPIRDEFVWSYLIVSLAGSFRGFQTGFMAPVVGYFVDRLHPRNLLVIGSVLGALGFFLLSKINSIWSFYACFMLLGISLSLNSQVVIFKPITMWFKKRTSLAFGIASAGVGLAGITIPLVVKIVDSFGWRNAMQLFAIGALVICVPLSFLVKDPPEKDSLTTNQLWRIKKPANSMTTREIMKKRNFWVLSWATLFSGVANSAITAHQIPYLVSLEMSRDTAAWMVVVYSLASVLGRVGFGWLGDNMDKRRCFILISIIQGFGLVAFAFSNSLLSIFLSLVFMGIGLGGVMPIRAVLQIDFFGMQSFSVIQGLSLVFITFGTMISPPFAGWIYDVFQNYQPAWIIFAILSFFTIPVILSASKNRQNAIESNTNANDIGYS